MGDYMLWRFYKPRLSLVVCIALANGGDTQLLCRETAPEAGDHMEGDCKHGVRNLCLLFSNETVDANGDHTKKMQLTRQCVR